MWKEEGRAGVYGVRRDHGGMDLDPARCRIYGVVPLKPLGGEHAGRRAGHPDPGSAVSRDAAGRFPLLRTSAILEKLGRTPLGDVAFVWSDRNGDGAPQSAEVEFFPPDRQFFQDPLGPRTTSWSSREHDRGLKERKVYESAKIIECSRRKGVITLDGNPTERDFTSAALAGRDVSLAMTYDDVNLYVCFTVRGAGDDFMLDEE